MTTTKEKIILAWDACASLNVFVRGIREGWWGDGSGEMEEGELQEAEAILARFEDLKKRSSIDD